MGGQGGCLADVPHLGPGDSNDHDFIRTLGHIAIHTINSGLTTVRTTTTKGAVLTRAQISEALSVVLELIWMWSFKNLTLADMFFLLRDPQNRVTLNRFP